MVGVHFPLPPQHTFRPPPPPVRVQMSTPPPPYSPPAKQASEAKAPPPPPPVRLSLRASVIKYHELVFPELSHERLACVMRPAGRPEEHVCFVQRPDTQTSALYFKRVSFEDAHMPHTCAIHLGAIHATVGDIKTEKLARTLVFDIDRPATAVVRGCECGPKQLPCRACWKILCRSAHVVHDVVGETFGATVVFFFSGCRGVHGWVQSTALARAQPNAIRRLVAMVSKRLADSDEPCFPLDTAVTTQKNHNIRCPFSAHPSTGRLVTPLRLDRMEMLDPRVDIPSAQAIVALPAPFRVQAALRMIAALHADSDSSDEDE
jgi:hypothetical protein